MAEWDLAIVGGGPAGLMAAYRAATRGVTKSDEHAPEQAGRRHVASLLDPWLPRRLAEALVNQAQIPADRRTAELSRQERQRLVQAVKRQVVPPAGTLGFEKAEMTAGGVALNEVDSRTLESKLLPDLFIASELLDLDGLIGGYNLQAAFSTGYLAGESV